MQSVDWLKHHTVKSNFVIHSKAKSQQHIIRTLNPLKGRDVNWLHLAIQV